MNIIFLDMDGVINSGETLRKIHLDENFKLQCLACPSYPERTRSVPFYIDPSLREKINLILENVDNCKIVWSSTWRMGLRNSRSFIEGFYNLCGFTEGSFLSYTPIMHEKRYIEILEWLRCFEKNYEIEKCVIIDDDEDAEIDKNKIKDLFGEDSIYYKLTEKYNPKFFQTNNLIGITNKIKNNILNYFENI